MNYSLERNIDTNSLDLNLTPKGQFRIMNGIENVFEIDFLGNTVFTNDIKLPSSCLHFSASNSVCTNSSSNSLDFSGPQGIRFQDDVLFRKNLMFGQGQGQGISYSDSTSNLSLFAENISFGQDKFLIQNNGPIVVNADTQMYGNLTTSGSVKAESANFQNVVKANELLLNGIRVATKNGHLSFDDTIQARQLDVTNINVSNGIQVNAKKYGPLIEAKKDASSRSGIGYYKNNETRVYGSKLDERATVNIGFANGSDTWDDRVIIRNGNNSITMNGDITVNGKINFGNYTFEVDQGDKSKINVSANGVLKTSFKY